MTKIKIDEFQCSEFFKSINNLITQDLKGGIDSFNSQIDILQNGVTWRGSDAVSTVSSLIETYNAFIDSYNRIITYFKEEVPKIFVKYSEILTAAGGTSLTITNVDANIFPKKELANLSYAGEDGDPNKLLEIKPLLVTAVSTIQDAFASIKTKLTTIGDDSDFFNTSAANVNMAQALRNDVTNFITDLDSKYDETLNTCIKNVETAANNLKS